MMESQLRVPALIVVDMQEDFCSPAGFLPVTGARALAPTINELLSRRGFALRLATADAHPPDHVSFAEGHAPPNNVAFLSEVEVKVPSLGSESGSRSEFGSGSGSALESGTGEEGGLRYRQRLWPRHCVRGTSGAALIPEIDATRFDAVVYKGCRADVEMYSAFADAVGRPARELPGATAIVLAHHDGAQTVSANDKGNTVSHNNDPASLLAAAGVTDVFVVGVAGDYCVCATALGVAAAGFRTFVVADGVRSVEEGGEGKEGKEGSGWGWPMAKAKMQTAGVRVLCVSDEVVEAVAR